MPRPFRDTAVRALAFLCVLTPAHLPAAAPQHRQVVTRVPPAYPELARRMHVSGEVIVRAVILADGSVSETHVESGHALLRQAAEDAVRHWRFAASPATSDCIVSVVFDAP
jgi:TonB family protein